MLKQHELPGIYSCSDILLDMNIGVSWLRAQWTNRTITIGNSAAGHGGAFLFENPMITIGILEQQSSSMHVGLFLTHNRYRYLYS
jgi:hypothetical protein